MLLLVLLSVLLFVPWLGCKYKYQKHHQFHCIHSYIHNCMIQMCYYTHCLCSSCTGMVWLRTRRYLKKQQHMTQHKYRNVAYVRQAYSCRSRYSVLRFYSHQAFVQTGHFCVNTKTRLMHRKRILKIRLVFQTGFYVRQALVQDTAPVIPKLYSKAQHAP